ncbi:MAG: dihydrolipoamide acetyltransferase family protein [Erythrobacter sp.]|uniref:dihydrolipoamide acetyltransferase family protein n=1 Tax=Erythrobacter sp. TaxID=1042 RepID=UPI00261CE1F3|nr:dihydrolipoamide acetyltransferase family protein [Erythrobacter sp.]MDJ0977573.1 dihydrolipoamide acetyltransferase family protein [Erythrobacter sp.]
MGVFTMPSLGADMEAGVLVEWLKAPGDAVDHGDIIAVVETDKGAIEVEVFEGGTIGELLVEAGEKVPVGAELARINGMVGTAQKPELASAPAPKPGPEPMRAEPKLGEPRTPTGATPKSLRASPAARRLAEEHGVDLETVTGTGPDGAIQRTDVEAATTQLDENAAPDLAPMRRAIAAAMKRSKREIPHYYLTHSFDISSATRWLAEYNSERPPPQRLLLGALLLKATALALSEFPEFNGFFGEDGFTPSEAIHLGSAISIRGGGLAAPAIRDTNTLSLPDLMVRLRDLVARTRRGQFRSSEISDPTATVSSLGERGVESLLPVIYPPQVAIVGFGSATRRPWAVKDTLAIRPVLSASLAGDHRANDGHRGALLLRRIEALLNEPETL